MADLYAASPSSTAGLTPSAEDFSSLVQQYLHSSSSSASSHSCMPSTTKFMNVLNSQPPGQPSLPLPSRQPDAASADPTFPFKAGLPGDQPGSGGVMFRTQAECRAGVGSSAAVGLYAVIASSSGVNFSDTCGIFPVDLKESTENAFCSTGVVDSDANALAKRRVSSENDLGDFSCDSETGAEASEMPSNRVPSRSSSKRSRSAEVHNLSEKRRRSRINEKMKALQSLIPNSNKTDKASMLDEAIEYLKQLQLQVQMLSMRNGLRLHPMCLPGGILQSTHMPQLGMEFDAGNPTSGRGIDSFPGNEECPLESTFTLLPTKCRLLDPPVVTPSETGLPSETYFGFGPMVLPYDRHFNPSSSSKDICRDALPNQQDNNQTGNSSFEDES